MALFKKICVDSEADDGFGICHSDILERVSK